MACCLPRTASAATTVYSSNGYQVHIDILFVSLVVHTGPCPWGYNYDVKLAYQISFTGPNQPANMYTLQGNVVCGSTSLFFNLPKGPSSGTVTTTGNGWRGQSDCATASLALLQCNSVRIQIQGPGIPNQYINISAGTLPVTLTEFAAEATAQGVQLNWATASEQDNDHFMVDRSLDGIEYGPVLQVAGAGNSTQVIRYEAFDPQPVHGLAYHRLRQVDTNGHSTIYPAMPVAARRNVLPLQPWPNPAEGNTVRLGDDALQGVLEVRAANGRLVQHTAVHGGGVEIPGLPPRVYHLQLLDTGTGVLRQGRLVRL